MDGNDWGADAMTDAESDHDDAEVIQMALKALSEAQARALASGRPVTFVENDELVRVTGSERVVLKKLPPSPTALELLKRAGL
jgi:hypothetical protein